MKLIIDENITFAKEAFSSFGDAKLLDGRALTNKDVRDADVLVVRSITNVNEDLLKNSNVKFVGTATIGTDHIDLQYLKNQKIRFADAKGCNADSVAEYIFTALLKVASEKNIYLQEKIIGVVGIGNIGSRVVRIAEALGMRVLQNDPPLERKGIGNNYSTLDDVLQADIITFHVPMSYEGIDKTFHLLNRNNLKKIKKGAIIINSSRGAVINNSALLAESDQKELNLILDVWENEPSINTELLAKTKISTPHIAGYSFEGKVNGTKMIYNSLCKYLNIQPSWQPILPEIEYKRLRFTEGKTDEEKLYNLFSSIYNIEKDDERMRKVEALEPEEHSAYFDLLRKKYPVRREFSNYTVQISENEIHLKSFLENFRFTVEII
jgi:erythronate-4-phosphate dehydrogenase